MKNYKKDKITQLASLPGRGQSVVRMADGLGDPIPLH